MKSQSKHIDCSWGKVHLVEFNNNLETSIICLHGWLDNWASFQAIAKHLKYRLVCIDLPGHGQSTHLPEGNWYHFVDYIVRLREITNKLKLQNFHMIGHSMGAAIACLYSSTFPESVQSLTMIDGLGPSVNSPEEARNILRESILNRERIRNKPKPIRDLELAVKARMSNGEISYEAARQLVENQINQIADGYEWSFDYKLKQTSSLRLSKAQLSSFFQDVKCPSLLIQADSGNVDKTPYWDFRSQIKYLSVIKVKGRHHLHMENPEEVSSAINSFLRKIKES